MGGRCDFKIQLDNSVFIPSLQGDSKQAVIEEMIDALVAQDALPSREGALAAILEREARMSTGMQCGVALPHGKLGTIEQLATVVGLKPDGLDFQALDGQPSRIFVLVLSPVIRPDLHTRFLGEIGRALDCPAVREQLLKTGTREEMIRVFTAT